MLITISTGNKAVWCFSFLSDESHDDLYSQGPQLSGPPVPCPCYLVFHCPALSNPLNFIGPSMSGPLFSLMHDVCVSNLVCRLTFMLGCVVLFTG